MLHLLLSTSSAVLRPSGFLVLLRSVVQNLSPQTMLSLELPVFPSLCSLSRKRRGAPSALSGSERIDALRYQRIKKAKKMTMNNNNSKIRKKAGVIFVLLYFFVIYTVICITIMIVSSFLDNKMWEHHLLHLNQDNVICNRGMGGQPEEGALCNAH